MFFKNKCSETPIVSSLSPRNQWLGGTGGTNDKGLKKVTDGSWKTRLGKVLFRYRITPQSTTGMAPTDLLLGYRPKSRLDLLKLPGEWKGIN